MSRGDVMSDYSIWDEGYTFTWGQFPDHQYIRITKTGMLHRNPYVEIVQSDNPDYEPVVVNVDELDDLIRQLQAARDMIRRNQLEQLAQTKVTTGG